MSFMRPVAAASALMLFLFSANAADDKVSTVCAFEDPASLECSFSGEADRKGGKHKLSRVPSGEGKVNSLLLELAPESPSDFEMNIPGSFPLETKSVSLPVRCESVPPFKISVQFIDSEGDRFKSKLKTVKASPEWTTLWFDMADMSLTMQGDRSNRVVDMPSKKILITVSRLEGGKEYRLLFGKMESHSVPGFYPDPFPAKGSAEGTVRIDTSESKPVCEMLLGQNMVWPVRYIPGLGEYKNNWADVEAFVRKHLVPLKVQMLRFPGGLFSDGYHWREGVGPVESRPRGAVTGNKGWYTDAQIIGTDEFMKVCELTGASPLITANYGTGTPQEAADWVEYCNAPNDGSNPGGGEDFAALRAKNGHPAPYNVIYWEIGNEIWDKTSPKHRWGHTGVERYCERFEDFAKTMKAVDPRIKIGAVAKINTSYVGHKDISSKLRWNAAVSERLKRSADFLADHLYSPGGERADDRTSNPDYLLASLFSFHNNAKRMELWLDDIAKRRGVEKTMISVNEYSNDPFDHDMLSALHHAGQLITMIEAGVDHCCFWHAGELIGPCPKDNPRPTWFLLKMFADNYETQYHPVKVSAPPMPPFKWNSVPYSPDVPCLKGVAFRDKDSIKLLVVNFHPWLAVDATIDIGIDAGGKVSGSQLAASCLHSYNDYLEELQVLPKNISFAEDSGRSRNFKFAPASVTFLRYRLNQ